ncbi:MAG: PEGA domain-containing protein [Pseudomonadota bacterium]|nr:PEGA domain-containing protein [Pseudomonadota bacterium]
MMRWRLLLTLLPVTALCLAGCRTAPPVGAPRPAAAAPKPETILPEQSPRESAQTVEVRLLTEPPGGAVYLLGDAGRPVPSTGRIELAPGEYRFRAQLAGYRDGYLTGFVTYDGPRSMVVPLGPGVSLVTIASEPAGATLRVDDEVIGLTPVTMELTAGDHRIEVTRRDAEYRNDIIAVGVATPLHLKYELTPLREAGSGVDSARYSAARAGTGDLDAMPKLIRQPTVASPERPDTPAVSFDVSALAPHDLSDATLLAALFEFSNPGEILALYRAGRRSLLRHEPGGDVEAFIADARRQLRYPQPVTVPPDELVPVDARRARAEMVAALIGARGCAVLLDYDAGQLVGEGETIQRTFTDGPVTAAVLGGEEVRISSAGIGISLHGGVARVNPGQEPIEVVWRRKPGRLILEAADNCRRAPHPPPRRLLGREKQWITLVDEKATQRLVQFTRGPGVDGWIRQEIARPPPPLGQRIPLARVEVGPHETPGTYERVWLLTFAYQGGVTQRLFRARYQVAPELKAFQTHQFLRRGQSVPAGPR